MASSLKCTGDNNLVIECGISHCKPVVMALGGHTHTHTHEQHAHSTFDYTYWAGARLCVIHCALTVCVCLYQSIEAQLLSSRGLAKSRMSKLGSSDLPRPSSTMMANTMEAKLLSSLTYKRKKNIRNNINERLHSTV